MKLLQLQMLRGLAALLVVVFHAQSVCPAYVDGASASAAFMGRFGSYGVDLFFVLSGFIIRHTEPAEGHDAWVFLRRRLCRIVPAYWLLTLVAVVLGFFSANPRVPELSHLVESFAFVSFVEGRQPLLYVGWSLEFELFFYLATFACISCARTPWRTLVVSLSGLSLVGSALELAQVNALPSLRGFFLDPLLLEFSLGVVLADWMRVRRLDSAAALALLGALLAVLVVRFEHQGGRVIVAGVPATLLLALCVVSERRGWFRAPVFLVGLGDASYSTYLLQVFTLPAFARLGNAIFDAPSADGLVALATVGTLASGFAFHRLVEKPLGRWVSARFGAQRAGAQGEAGAVLYGNAGP